MKGNDPAKRSEKDAVKYYSGKKRKTPGQSQLEADESQAKLKFCFISQFSKLQTQSYKIPGVGTDFSLTTRVNAFCQKRTHVGLSAAVAGFSADGLYDVFPLKHQRSFPSIAVIFYRSQCPETWLMIQKKQTNKLEERPLFFAL